MGAAFVIFRPQSWRLTQSDDVLRRSTSSILRSTKSVGTSILGPARRFKRRSSDGLSPGDEILYTSGVGAVEEPEYQSECHNEAPLVNGTDLSQSHIMASKCPDVELGVRKFENPKMVSPTRNDVGNFVDSKSLSKPSNSHQRNPPKSPLEPEKENNPPLAAFQNRKSTTIHLDKHIHPVPGHKEKQNGTPSFTSHHAKRLVFSGQTMLTGRLHLPKCLFSRWRQGLQAQQRRPDRKKRVHVTINNNAYQRLECIGRGGSCRVYRVMSENFKVWALKKVSLADADEQAVRGFKGEIELLRRLANVDRVVQLRDWEVNEAKQTLSLVNHPVPKTSVGAD
jgi:hypothetical protein